MKEHGLKEREKWSPQPGTGRDPAGIPNPAGYVDPQTLLNATELILRAQGQRREPEFDAVADGVMILEPVRELTQQEAADKIRMIREMEYGRT